MKRTIVPVHFTPVALLGTDTQARLTVVLSHLTHIEEQKEHQTIRVEKRTRIPDEQNHQ